MQKSERSHRAKEKPEVVESSVSVHRENTGSAEIPEDSGRSCQGGVPTDRIECQRKTGHLLLGGWSKGDFSYVLLLLFLKFEMKRKSHASELFGPKVSL